MTTRISTLAATALLAAATLQSASYEAEIEKWREQRETRLTSDTGWLTVTGLFWLKEGANPVGSAESNRVVLPANASPAQFGVIDRSGRKFVLRYADRSKGSVELKPDMAEGGPTRITAGDVTFWVIERGEKFGIRMRDKQSKLLKDFTGCKWFPVKPEYRIEGRFVPDKKTVSVPSVIGVNEDLSSPGYVEFEIHGETVRLRPTGPTDDLFFVFRDGTSGKATYGASRFLYSSVGKDGKVVLDFNKAYNPPCMFTPYATCPLPTRENRLKVPIEAGELTYGTR